MKEKKYNFFRIHDLLWGALSLLLGSYGLFRELNKNNVKIFALLFFATLVLWGCICLLSSMRYKAHAILGQEGIRVCTKNDVLATISWDDIVDCQFSNPYGGELRGGTYTVLFTKNAKSLDPKSFNYKKDTVDRHMYALYKGRMTPQEFKSLEMIAFYSYGGKAETDEIECMINNYKNRNNGDKTGDDTVC